MAASTTCLSIDLSRATESAICKSSSLLAAMPGVAILSLLFALLFARLQIFGDQLVGEDKLGFGDLPKRKLVAGALRLDDDFGAVEAEQGGAEALAPVDRRSEFDFRLMAGPTGEIGETRQRPVDAGRRN